MVGPSSSRPKTKFLRELAQNPDGGTHFATLHREISNVGRYSSQSNHQIRSLQLLYLLRTFLEKYRAKLTSRFKFTQY
jgi:hypothetical protein